MSGHRLRGAVSAAAGKFGGLQPLLLPLNDMATAAFSCVLAFFLPHWLTGKSVDWPWPDGYQSACVFAVVLLPLVFHAFGLYRSWRGDEAYREIFQLLAAWLALHLGLVVLAGVTKTTASYSRLWFSSWLVLGAAILLLSRLGMRWTLKQLRRYGFDQRSVVLVGDAEPIKYVSAQLRERPELGFHLQGYFAAAPFKPSTPDAASYLGTLHGLHLISKLDVDQIWLAFSDHNYEGQSTALKALQGATVNVRLIPDLFSLSMMHAQALQVGGITMLELNRNPIEGFDQWVKTIEDKVLASVMLVLFAPVMAFIALAIKLTSPGPVLFRQVRRGWHGQQFRIYKFRTMRVHQEAAGILTQAARGDERIFPLGAWLRRYSLDELPQLFNVINGSMSLVGPRPHAEEHHFYFRDHVSHFMWRHSIKPGITGWAQIHGLRGGTETLQHIKQRLEYDLYYIQHWSLWLDLEILLFSVFRGFSNPNAY